MTLPERIRDRIQEDYMAGAAECLDENPDATDEEIQAAARKHVRRSWRRGRYGIVGFLMIVALLSTIWLNMKDIIDDLRNPDE